MADHNKPTITSSYANYTAELDSRMDDLAMLNDPSVTTVTNPVSGYKRWNSVTYKLEKYNGTAWVDLSSRYILGAIDSTSGDVTTLTSSSTSNPVLSVVNSASTNASRVRVGSTQGTDTNKFVDIFYAPSNYSAVPSQASFGVVESYANKGLILSALNGSEGVKIQTGNRVDAIKVQNDSVVVTNADIGVGTTVSKPSGFNKFVSIGDADSGIGQLSDGYISVATNGVERLRFNPVNWNIELGTKNQGNAATEVDIFLGNQTNSGYVFGNNDQFGMYSPNSWVVLDKRSGANANASLGAGYNVSLIAGNAIINTVGGNTRRILYADGSCVAYYNGDALYEDLTLSSTTVYVGKKIKLSSANSSAQRAVYEDVYNENNIPIGSHILSANTDGSFSQSFVVTPSGPRNSDRQVTALEIKGDASLNAYNGAIYAKPGNGSVLNSNNCGYAFAGDNDSGWFNPSDGVIRGFVNGLQFLEADSANNRKINFGPSNAYSAVFQDDGNFVVYNNIGALKFTSNDFANFYAGVKSPIGWRKLPDGTIEQWGYVDNPGSGSGTVTLPTAFPNAIWNIQITRKTPSSDFWPVQVNGTPSLGSFPWSQTGNNVNTSFYWRALGK